MASSSLEAPVEDVLDTDDVCLRPLALGYDKFGMEDDVCIAAGRIGAGEGRITWDRSACAVIRVVRFSGSSISEWKRSCRAMKRPVQYSHDWAPVTWRGLTTTSALWDDATEAVRKL